MRVENAATPGTPDVECTLGWIELKHLEHTPSYGDDGDRMFRLPHFRPAQRAWLAKRSLAGGKCWLLLRAGSTTAIWEGGWAARHLGRTTWAEAAKNAIGLWTGGDLPDARKIEEVLRG